jgi:hypothetical protein
MTTFQIISVILSALLLLGTIFGVYLKLKIDLTKVDMRLNEIDRELLQKEISLLLIEKINREDHKEIISKIDHLVEAITVIRLKRTNKQV